MAPRKIADPKKLQTAPAAIAPSSRKEKVNQAHVPLLTKRQQPAFWNNTGDWRSGPDGFFE
jgi:hypothetical protein